MVKEVNRFIYWTPRILSIVFIIFFALMSLDVMALELSLWESIVGLLMHNIPTIIMLIVLLIAWKYEIVGGIAYLLGGLAYIIMTTQAEIPWYIALSWSLNIAGPAFLIGVLFLINWYKKRQK